ncbi:VpsF family polysaccharide biosynthesis protein [Devosia sp.]|uniref:VpsF family polysaccharide biosynthesis protein n=1 Tax=Devosia sp. TaxID=1871048 RepID=UPI003A8D5A61
MSYSAAEPQLVGGDDARRQNALSLVFFLLTAVALLMRFSITPEIMNSMVEYSTLEGATWEKVHFGSYALFALLPFALFSRPIVLRGHEITLFRTFVRYSALLIGLIGFMVVTGRAGSSGFVLDTYLVAGAAGLIMLSQNAEARRALGDVTLIMLLVSALIGIFEAVTQTRVLPYPLTEDVFRPTGLTEHPLAFGAMCATGIGFATLARWPLWLRLMAAFVLFIGCAASGARLALLIAGMQIVLLLLFVPWTQLSARHERQAKTIVLVMTLVAGAALISLMFAAGLLSRFGDTLFDENFMARITVYEVFGYATPRELLMGKDLSAVLEIVNTKLNLPYIESSVVVVVFLFGIPLALFFVWVVGRMMYQLLRNAPVAGKLATLTFMLAVLSNNALSSKTAMFCIVVVLLIAYQRSPPAPARLG